MKRTPQINFDTKPRITFSLDPILINYCRYIFKTPSQQKLIILNRKEDLGKLIFSHIQAGDFKNNRPFIKHPVIFILPTTNCKNDNWLRNRYIFVPKWVENKFAMAIEYEFKWWVREKFRVGYEDEGWDQKTIVNAILRGLNVRNNAVNSDTIKKIDYRTRRKEEKIRFKKLCLKELTGD